MEKFNSWFMYDIGRYVGSVANPLSDDASAKVSEYGLRFAGFALSQFLKDLEPHVTPPTMEAGEELLLVLRAEVKRIKEEAAGVPQGLHLGQTVETALKHFETLLARDMGESNIFSVPSVLAYDSKALIEKGTKLIPKNLSGLLPDLAEQDINEATRCLVFGLPTASTFHIVRATEEVMRVYYKEFVGALPPNDSDKTMGAMHGVFKQKGLSDVLLADIAHVKDNYRNPVSHPGTINTVDEAQRILPSCVNVINHMLEEISNKRASE